MEVEAVPLIKGHLKMLEMSVLLCYFYCIYAVIKFLPSLLSLYYYLVFPVT